VRSSAAAAAAAIRELQQIQSEQILEPSMARPPMMRPFVRERTKSVSWRTAATNVGLSWEQWSMCVKSAVLAVGSGSTKQRRDVKNFFTARRIRL